MTAPPTWRTSSATALRQPTLIALADGRVLTMRGASDADLNELLAMHARCGRRTLQSRYLTGLRPPSRRVCRGLLRTDLCLVAESPTGAVVGLGNLASAEEDPGVAEIAVIVEDDWQGRGIGTALVRQLVAGARLLGFTEVVAISPTVGGWLSDALARLGDPLLQRTPFGEAVVRLALAPHHVGLLSHPSGPATRAVISRAGVAAGR